MSTNKSFSTETSERYSRALFEVANEANELSKVEGDIKVFQTLFDSSSELKNFIQKVFKFMKSVIIKRFDFI